MAKRPRGAARPARRKAARKTGRTVRKTAKQPNARKRKAPARATKTARKKTAPARKKTAARKKPAPARKKTASRRAPAAKRPTGRTAKAAHKRPSARKATPAKKAAPVRKPSRAAGSAQPAVARKLPRLDRERRILRDEPDEHNSPSSLDYEHHHSSGADTGRAEMEERRRQHHESDPRLTGGDVDANWEGAYFSGDEAPGGDNPTPDQDVVEEIGRSLGLEYQDNEELHEKVTERDKHRWELDPASSEDYRNRGKD